MQDHPIQPGSDVSWLRDLVRLAEQLRRSLDLLDVLDERIREALNASYQQGVRDATERRTHVAPHHG